MRLQFQILIFLIVATCATVSQNTTVSLLTINSTVGVGGTIAPSASKNVTTAPLTLTTVTMQNLTSPPPTTVTTKAAVANATTVSNMTLMTTTSKPKTSTNFPQTCQSLDTLVQSGDCYYALEGISAEVGSVSLTSSKSIANINGYCSTFSTCYPAIEKCANFDQYSINILKTFCDFYQFLTSKFFLTCAQNMEGLSTPCSDDITMTILDFNATTTTKCKKLMNSTSCAVEESNFWCTTRASQNYQMFLNRHIQEWMC